MLAKHLTRKRELRQRRKQDKPGFLSLSSLNGWGVVSLTDGEPMGFPNPSLEEKASPLRFFTMSKKSKPKIVQGIECSKPQSSEIKEADPGSEPPGSNSVSG